MSKLDGVKKAMSHFFGASTASMVDGWVKDGLSESQIIDKARTKVKGFLGEDHALEFDKMIKD